MISVIVPIYNSAHYLSECIESICRQDFRDWELLLVDDGSTDNSAEIAREWAGRDSRIKYFHKTNGGVSSARNYGLDHAAGEYIMFVDSDDLCDHTMLSALSVAVRKNLDMSVCTVRRFCDGDRMELSANISDNDIEVHNGIGNIFRQIDNLGLVNPPYGRIYKSEIIGRRKIRFDESLSLGEDLLFNLDYLGSVNTCAFIRRSMYYYRDTNGSLSKDIRQDYADIQMRLTDSKLDFVRANNIQIDYSRAAPGIVRDMFLSLCRSKGSAAVKAGSIKRLKKHRIMKMAQGHGSLSDAILISAIRFLPANLLIKIIR